MGSRSSASIGKSRSTEDARSHCVHRGFERTAAENETFRDASLLFGFGGWRSLRPLTALVGGPL